MPARSELAQQSTLLVLRQTRAAGNGNEASDWRGASEKENASTEIEALLLQRRSSNVHLLRTATRPSIGGRAGLGIAQGPPKVRPMSQVLGEVVKELVIFAWAINDGFSGGRGIRAPAVTGSSSRGTSRAKLPG
jgi:hypothetical protein